MLKLTDQQIAEYFKRSYMAVDGLWFVKIEEKLGFDTALDLDIDVWKIMPKIQVRKLKSLVPVKEGLEGLYEAFATKLNLEGYTYEPTQSDGCVEFKITKCPWHEIMIKSDRKHVAEKVGSAICTAEGTVWASEFGKNITCQLAERICSGASCCRMRFVRTLGQSPAHQ